jgi:hypothetical protein
LGAISATPAGLQIFDAFDGRLDAAGSQFREHAGALTARQFLHFVGDRFAAAQRDGCNSLRIDGADTLGKKWGQADFQPR